MQGKIVTAEQYIDLIRQALFEIEDVRAAIEFEEGGMSGTDGFIHVLEKEIRALYARMQEGSYYFENKDLPFMPLVLRQSTQTLPFKNVLEEINRIHRNGLDVEEI